MGCTRITRISGLVPINLGNRIIEARGVARSPLDLFSLGRSHWVSHYWEPVVRVIQFLSSSPLLCLISLYGVVRQDSSPKFTCHTGFMCISMLNTPRTIISSTATVVTYDVVQLFLPLSPNVLSYYMAFTMNSSNTCMVTLAHTTCYNIRMTKISHTMRVDLQGCTWSLAMDVGWGGKVVLVVDSGIQGTLYFFLATIMLRCHIDFSFWLIGLGEV